MHPVIQTFRPGFLLLAPVCALTGIATAQLGTQTLSEAQEWLISIAIITCATSALVSVNTFNEYNDFYSGLDNNTRRTAFSGGSGALPAYPQYANTTLYAALASLAITLIIGIGFIVWRGLLLLPVATIGIFLIIAYTPLLTRKPWLCLIAPGLAFGPLMIMGADAVLRGHYSMTGFSAALPVFFLVSNLLLLNQLPDIDADRKAGRNTVPIAAGIDTSIRVYGIFLLAAYASLSLAISLNALPLLSATGLLTAPLGLGAWQIARTFAGNSDTLLPALKLNVLVSLLTPTLISAGIFFSR